MNKQELYKGIKAAIFDLDGTLVDSMGIWGDIDIEFFHKHNMEVPKDYFVNIGHMSFMEMAKYTSEKFHFKETPEEIASYWVQESEDGYANKVPAKPYARELLEELKRKEFKISLATSNRKELYEPCLKHLNMYQYFDYFLNVNDLKSSKGEPKIYLNLALMMNSKPKETFVFEDIVTACKTAHNAGFRTLGVYDPKSEKDAVTIKANTDYYLKSFKEILD